MNLEVGTVFRWDNFPDARYGSEEKARWFICVGFSGKFAQIAMVYLCTTTTQLEKFKKTGSRAAHSKHIFTTNQFQCFEQDCAIDFDERPYPLEKSKLSVCQKDIEIRGSIDKNTLRMIYNRFFRSRSMSYKEIVDIHDSFNMAGITGLKKPKPYLR